MGPLTEDMTRLCAEIVALRGARQTFVKDLTHQVAALKANFRRTRHDQARKARADRHAFVKHLTHSVAAMQATFRHDHAHMARKTKAERLASLKHLKVTVAGLRRAFALDLRGAHRAWFGPSPAERQAEAAAARRAHEEAERRRAETAARVKAEAEKHRQVHPPAKVENKGPGKKKA